MSLLFCIDCNELTNHIPKLSAVLDGNLVCEKCRRMNGFCTLTKIGDSYFAKQSKDIRWVEYDENQRGKEMHLNPKIGYGLFMSPFDEFFFTWRTTEVTEIIEETENSVHFKTSNSEYKLFFNRDVIDEYSKSKKDE